jgi:AhpD family alkylhydroperoxidase
MSSFNKKSWIWHGSIQDHIRILGHLPFFFVAPLVLSSKQGETVHLSVNSVNDCQFCTDLHGELGRMAGLTDAKDQELDLFEQYGNTFARNNGHGADVDSKYDAISDSKGVLAARSARGLAYFLMWGSLGGNTVNGFLQGTLKGNTKAGSNVIFEVFFVLYYGILFVVIDLTSRILKMFPSGVHPVVNIVIGLILPTVASMWIIPYALVSVVLVALLPVFKSDETFEPISGSEAYTSLV